MGTTKLPADYIYVGSGELLNSLLDNTISTYAGNIMYWSPTLTEWRCLVRSYGYGFSDLRHNYAVHKDSPVIKRLVEKAFEVALTGSHRFVAKDVDDTWFKFDSLPKRSSNFWCCARVDSSYERSHPNPRFIPFLNNIDWTASMFDFSKPQKNNVMGYEIGKTYRVVDWYNFEIPTDYNSYCLPGQEISPKLNDTFTVKKVSKFGYAGVNSGDNGWFVASPSELQSGAVILVEDTDMDSSWYTIDPRRPFG